MNQHAAITLHPALRWAESGLMALTGHSGGPPQVPERDYLARLDLLLRRVETLAAVWGAPLQLDHRMFTERAAILGLSRRGRISANGTCRLIEGRDGWLAVNLARPDDVNLLPAWIGADGDGDPWVEIEEAARKGNIDHLLAGAEMLGIPAARASVGAAPVYARSVPLAPFVIPARAGMTNGGRAEKRAPIVIDLSSLWAGPLCGQLLTQVGARVIKVESLSRPDGARRGPSAFYDLLHGGQESVALDFVSAVDRDRMLNLILAADLVIESSRPRALRQLDIDRDKIMRRKPSLTWVSITAHGRDDNRVGFGDDAAASAGLLVADADGRPVFVGDAIADPIAGVTAAAGALDSLLAGGGRTVDVSLSGAARFVADAPPITDAALVGVIGDQGAWFVEVDGVRARAERPVARAAGSRAPELGRDTRAVLAEFGP